MSWKILIYRAKPNPAGKDRAAGSPLQSQLLGEWVDLQNSGDASVILSTLNLCHIEFSSNCIPAKNSTIYWTGKNNEALGPGQTVRVHTGKSDYSSIMSEEDKRGVDFHAYAEKGNFVLNNKCGDTISAWWKDTEGKWHKEDVTSYDPNPPDGAVLKRVGSKLIP